ncbi:MAG: D-alanine--D-alanine ligase, partial [Calditrichaeota bacterium]
MSLKIAVILGGTSAERDVSLVSGREISRALREKGHQVSAIDCAFGDALIEDWDRDINEIIHVQHSDFETRKSELNKNIFKTIDYLISNPVDVVFNALHGGYGENGKLQALLDLAGIPYTGSDSLASGIGMNKNISKILFKKSGVPTAPWKKIERSSPLEKTDLSAMELPLVVKPSDQGSTVGLTVVNHEEQLQDAIALAFQFSDSILLEKFIEGREVTVAILDDSPLPVIEIIPEHGIYDYECKYQKGKSRYVVPAEIPEEVALLLQKQALDAYRSVGCRHYARVDFRLTSDYNPFCLEVNTLPGMTATSLVPKAA